MRIDNRRELLFMKVFKECLLIFILTESAFTITWKNSDQTNFYSCSTILIKLQSLPSNRFPKLLRIRSQREPFWSTSNGSDAFPATNSSSTDSSIFCSMNDLSDLRTESMRKL